MGEIAEAILEGDFCEGCGVDLGAGDGYPRRCADCQKEKAQKKDEKIERVEWAKVRLAGEGCDIEPGPDKWSLKVYFRNGKRFHFWPYSGWFAELKGQGKGRGIANLVRCANGLKQRNRFGIEVPE